MKDKIIDTKFTEVNNSSKEYFTIEEVSNILSVDVPTVIFWYNKFNYILNIQSIGMYQIFTKHDINNLQKIKSLSDKNMTVNEIKLYLKENKEIIISERKKELNEVSIIPILEEIIKFQGGKINEITKSYNKIINFTKQIIENQQNYNDVLSKLYQNELNNTKILNRIQETQLKESNNIQIKKIDSKLDTLKSEIAADTEKQIQDLKKSNEEKQLEITKTLEELLKTTSRIEKHKAEEQSKKENSIWNKLFKRNKSENEDK